MKVKHIEKMYKWNAIDLTPNQIRVGLKRIKFLTLYKSTHFSIPVIEIAGVYQCTLCLVVNVKGKSKMVLIARRGKNAEQAIAKCGLAAPCKKWNLLFKEK